MEQIFEELERNWGWNKTASLERVGNDLDFYGECLKAFSGDCAFDRLNIAYGADDCDGMFTQAHTLKGVSANLGLELMFNDLAELVEKLRFHDCRDLGRQVASINNWHEKLQVLTKKMDL